MITNMIAKKKMTLLEKIHDFILTLTLGDFKNFLDETMAKYDAEDRMKNENGRIPFDATLLKNNS
jgi:hypothetical protein